MEIRFAMEADFDRIAELAIQGQHFHVNLRPDIYLERRNKPLCFQKIIIKKSFVITI